MITITLLRDNLKAVCDAKFTSKDKIEVVFNFFIVPRLGNCRQISTIYPVSELVPKSPLLPLVALSFREPVVETHRPGNQPLVMSPPRPSVGSTL